MPIVESAMREAFVVIAILKRIPRNRWISTPELAASLEEAGIEISTRRLQRLLKNICEWDELCVECDMRSKPYGYKQRLPTLDLAATHLRPQESLLLRLSEEHLRYQLPAPLVRSLSPLFETARTTLKESGSTTRMNAWLKKVAFVSGAVPMLPPKILPRIFDAVSEGLYRESKLEIEYVNSIGQKTVGIVSPLGLVQQDQRLYLVCQFDGYDNIRHLALHRMLTAHVLDFPAVRPKDFTLDKYVAERHFNYSNGRKIHLTLEFTNMTTAKNMAETPFNKTQTLKQLPDGAWRLEADLDDTVMLDGWIAAWKDAAGIRKVEKTPVDDDLEAEEAE